MFVVNSPTGLSLNAIGIKCNNTIGTLTAWDIYYRPDNYQTVSGANTSSTGWTLLTSLPMSLLLEQRIIRIFH